ncbi:MAG: polysaccharide biosynthesis protein [Lachnospiraceae bacterium]|nr:polysaccharide biosynthesis protein [Lachnospiraceae bacterium]
MYKSVWRYVSFTELARCLEATAITFVIQIAGTTLFFMRMPITYYCLGIMLQFAFTLGIRFSYRIFLIFKRKQMYQIDGVTHRVMMIGAGEAAQLIMRDIHKNPNNPDQIVCVIDDNSNKWNRYIEGVPIVGGRDDILKNVEKYDIDRIYLAIPNARVVDKRDILNICSETNCEIKQLPSMQVMVGAEVGVNMMQNVSVEDLLGRETIRTDMKEVYDFIHDKVILVTGGGGSIGSELCRQISAHKPAQLIIFDIYENNAYDIQNELKSRYPDLNLVTLIGSVRDSRRINQVFEQYRPDVVYHAAAHKHVPLMEDSPCESIKNNVIGTYKTAYAAVVNGCKKFVLISTDKAVNPTNVMGASKRMCEMIIQSFDRKIKFGKLDDILPMFTHGDDDVRVYNKKERFVAEDNGSAVRVYNKKEQYVTDFVAVRFGNVLGSNGSVIPLFKKQIAAGGPVTVTHPDIIRYFMTIPEAVSLVMQAGVYAKGGEIFVLDMGSPMKIDTLARNLIKLSGFRPDEDIKIEYTGLRPGEKMYEEKLMDEEGLEKTPNELIHIGKPLDFDTDTFLMKLERLMESAYDNDPQIKRQVADIVTTYKIQE